MSINNQQTNEDNILTTIIRFCKQVHESVEFLSSIIKSQTGSSTKDEMEEVTGVVEAWISRSVKVIKNATENFMEDEKLQPPQPMNRAGSVSLLPIPNDPGSIIVQLILWSCISEECRDSITNCLYLASVQKCDFPQESTSASKGMLWTWLQSYAFCIKTSVHYSCKYILTTVKGSNERLLGKSPILNSVLLETCFLNGSIFRSAKFFTMIGTNAKPLGFLTSSKSSSEPHDTSSRIQSKDMAVEATKQFLRYLKTRPKVAFLQPPTRVIGVGGLGKQTHFSDILTLMQKKEDVQNKIKSQTSQATGKIKGGKHPTIETKPVTSSQKDKKDEKRKVHCVVQKSITLSQIRPKLEILQKTLRLNFKSSLKIIEESSEKIAKKCLSGSSLEKLGKWACAKIAVLSTCVSTLLEIKTSKLNLGEKVLLKLVSDAIQHTCEAQHFKTRDILGDLLEQLTQTLFKDTAVITGIATREYEVPTHVELFWKTHFNDECNYFTSLGLNGSTSETRKKKSFLKDNVEQKGNMLSKNLSKGEDKNGGVLIKKEKPTDMVESHQQKNKRKLTEREGNTKGKKKLFKRDNGNKCSVINGQGTKNNNNLIVEKELPHDGTSPATPTKENGKNRKITTKSQKSSGVRTSPRRKKS